MSTVLLLLDAFRHDYLSEKVTPFLWKCATTGEHYQGVEQNLGFCERSEILTGLRADETGFFTAIGFDPSQSPYARVRELQLLDMVEKVAVFFLRLLPVHFSGRAHKKLRYVVSCHFRKLGIPMSTYAIPYPWLLYFALTEDLVDHRDHRAFPSPSILELLERKGRNYYYDTFTALNFRSPYSSDSERLEAVLHDAKESAKDLYLVYIAAPDAAGHRYGPESIELREIIRQLDMELERFVQNLEQVNPGNRYVLLGDHGMLTVTTRFDAEKEISRILRSVGLRKGREVIYFLDSTMVRFWAMTDKTRNLLPNALDSSESFLQNGSWMDDATASRNHVPWPDRRYGDYLWVANPGVLVFPDFFHRLLPCRGMHGYNPQLPESRGMCIHWGNGIASSTYPIIPLSGVFELLMRSLEL